MKQYCQGQRPPLGLVLILVRLSPCLLKTESALIKEPGLDGSDEAKAKVIIALHWAQKAVIVEPPSVSASIPESSLSTLDSQDEEASDVVLVIL